MRISDWSSDVCSSDLYDGKLGDTQLAQLAEIFPDGVCDFSKPAAEAVPHSMIWPSIGGERLEKPHELKWRVARSDQSEERRVGKGCVSKGRTPLTPYIYKKNVRERIKQQLITT